MHKKLRFVHFKDYLSSLCNDSIFLFIPIDRAFSWLAARGNIYLFKTPLMGFTTPYMLYNIVLVARFVVRFLYIAALFKMA